MPRNRRAHWLRGNRASRLPRRIICLDSEANTNIEDDKELHTFRLAFATYDEIDHETLAIRESDECAFLDTEELWRWVDSKCNRRHRTVLFAHNLSYDIRLCAALDELPELGWELRGFALDRFRCWLRWKKGDLSLSMCDTISFVGGALSTFAEPLDMAKVALPRQNEGVNAWLARCKSDTMLTREIVLRLLHFLRAENCGDFRLSGPAQGFAQYRHRFMPQKGLLVHEEQEQLDRERESAYAGRCEVWRHGAYDGEVFEWDFSCAYARVARDANLPIRYRGRVQDVSTLANLDGSNRSTYLAECRIRSMVPVLPARKEGKILWPIGEYDSLSWREELDVAREHGAEIEIRRAWIYRTAPVLNAWGTYILGELEGKNGELDPVARATLKQWSRTLIGRFGLRYPTWEECGRTDEHVCSLIRYVSADTGEKGQWLRLGTQVFDHSGTEESYDSAPAIMAFIVALSRIRLWRAILAAGFDNVLYCDTDSVICTAAGNAGMAEFSRTAMGQGMRLKASFVGGIFYGPRQIVMGGNHRIAGLPRNAQTTGENTWKATVWEGATHSLERGKPAEIMLSQRTIQMRSKDNRRRHLDGGLTEPLVMR